LTIQGDPTQAGITLSGGGGHRLFAVSAGASLTLEDLTLTGGKTQERRRLDDTLPVRGIATG
jgi:hypothetical protein